MFRILPLQHTAIQLGPGPLAFGLDSAAALPSLAAFPRFSSLIATPTSVHVSMSLGCNVEKSKVNTRLLIEIFFVVTSSFSWCVIFLVREKYLEQ